VGRLVDLPELEQVVEEARRGGKRIVFSNGCFDLLHRGHVEYLARARALGDLLIVGLNTDDSVRRLKGPGRPVNPLEDRAVVLAALGAVDFVVPFAEDTPEGLIRRLSPHVLVKGGDYRPDEVVGADWVAAHGGQVVIAEQVPGRSTSGMLRRLRALPLRPDT
jgi:D-beta-D-heptose 7-phosphate kinase/D-beta-D-heptose 1-phosphate adenosyltransferase